MKSINLKRFPCDQCGYNEDVEENKKPVIIPITVAGSPYQLCLDCVFKVKIWKSHVNEEHLRDYKSKPKPETPKTMEYLNEKTKELLKPITISRPWNEEVNS